MVTRGKSASRGNTDVQLRQCPDPDMYVFDLHVFFSTAYSNLRQ